MTIVNVVLAPVLVVFGLGLLWTGIQTGQQVREQATVVEVRCDADTVQADQSGFPCRATVQTSAGAQNEFLRVSQATQAGDVLDVRVDADGIPQDARPNWILVGVPGLFALVLGAAGFLIWSSNVRRGVQFATVVDTAHGQGYGWRPGAGESRRRALAAVGMLYVGACAGAVAALSLDVSPWWGLLGLLLSLLPVVRWLRAPSTGFAMTPGGALLAGVDGPLTPWPQIDALILHQPAFTRPEMVWSRRARPHPAAAVRLTSGEQMPLTRFKVGAEAAQALAWARERGWCTTPLEDPKGLLRDDLDLTPARG